MEGYRLSRVSADILSFIVDMLDSSDLAFLFSASDRLLMQKLGHFGVEKSLNAPEMS